MSTTAQAAMNTTLGDAIESYTRMGDVAPPALNEIYVADVAMPPSSTGSRARGRTSGRR